MTKICYIMCGAALSMVIAGCAGQQSRVEMDYGVSQRLAVANQTLNPDAGKNMEPVEGLDGPAGQRTYDQYLKSFEKPEKQPTYQLGVIGQGSK